MTAYEKEMVADFDAPDDDESDFALAMRDCKAWIQTNMVAGDTLQLVYPPNICNVTTPTGISGVGNVLACGVRGGIKITLELEGASILDSGGGFKLTDGRIHEVGFDRSIRIATIGRGATEAFALDPEHVTRLVLLDWVVLGGLDLQGPFNYPPNPAFYHRCVVTAIDEVGGSFEFFPPLDYDLRADWPDFNDVQYDIGGPAVCWILPTDYDVEVIVNGGTFDAYGGTYVSNRKTTLNGCVHVPSVLEPQHGFMLTMSGEVIHNACIQTDVSSEVDKINGRIVFNGGNINQLDIQSSGAANPLHCKNGFTVVNFNGMPKRLIVEDCNITNFGTGTLFGNNEWALLRNNVITTFATGNVGTGANNIDSEVGGNPVGGGATMVDGVITIPKQGSDYPLAIFVPGAWLTWHGQKKFCGFFQCTAVVEDGANSKIYTTWPGGFPDIARDAQGKLHIAAHPAPCWFGEGNTGFIPEILDHPNAQGRPAHSYINMTFTKASLPQGGGYGYLFGRLDEINVTHPTGYEAPDLKVELLGQGGANALDASGGDLIAFNPTIDANVSGNRSMDVSSESHQTGDTGFAALGTTWLCDQQGIHASRDPSGDTGAPSTTVEYITTQFTPTKNIKLATF